MRDLLIAFFSFMITFGCASATEVLSCPNETTNGRWSSACFEMDRDTRRIKQEYRKNVVLNKFGMAVIVLEPFEVVAVNRAGRVVVPGIAGAGDRDYPNAEQGIGRFYVGKKCGYFKSGTFKIIVPAEYDACHPFMDGDAGACKECTEYCTEEECHSSTFVGGTGFSFAANGRTLRKYALPKLEDACGKVGVDRIGKVHDVFPLLKCNEDPNSPFKM